MGLGPMSEDGCLSWFFYFFIFYFRFLQKYIFNLEIYRNIPRPPGSGAAGAFVQKFLRKKLRAGPWGPVARQRDGRPPKPPGSGAAGPGRPAAGRPALPPLYKGSLVPPPLICITKLPEKKGREAKPCRIFEPATAGNQNSSTLYKYIML